MTERTSPTGVHAFARELREMAWLYLVATLVLTALFVAGGAVGREEVLPQLAVNLLVMVLIGVSISAVQLLVLAPVAERLGFVGTAAGWATRVLSVGAGVWIGADLTARILVWTGVADDGAATRGGIVRIGTVVAAVFLGIAVLEGRAAARRAALEARERLARQEAALAQLQALQARTDPHFLFNALNAVASLIGAGDPDRAEEAVERLAGVFRYALEGSRRDRVPLGRELDAIDDYLAVEALRLGERLRVVKTVDASLRDVPIPPLVLQPLVENAVVHGVAPRRAGATVTIAVAVARGGLSLRVEDDGGGNGATGGSGTALADLRRRLALVAEGAYLDAGPTEGGWAAEVWLPLERS